jgi:microsomal dipeptidase-like Zn-dependent dipeptidase
METPDKFANIEGEIHRRGYSEADVRKILGENWIRLFETVWK